MSNRKSLNGAGLPPRIAVIGAGVVGLACALRLLRDGWRVTLYDPEAPGSQTSSGNAALIMTAQISPLSQPGLWRKVPKMLADREGPLVVRWGHLPQLMPWFMRFLANSRWSQYEKIADALTPMVTRSLKSWLALAGSGADRLIRQDGLLYVFQAPENLAGGLREAQFRKRYGIPSEHIPPEQLRQMEPALAPGLAGGVLYPESGHTTDPAALSAALYDAFLSEGGEIRRERVYRLKPEGDGPVRLETAGGDESADQAIVCAGVWSPHLMRPLGLKPMIAAERGYHLMAQHLGEGVRRPIGAGDDKFIITPLDHGVRLAGTAEFAAIDAPPDWRRSDILFGMANKLLPGLKKTPEATRWMGRRPSTPDGLPMIGRTPGAPSVICAFGHGHLGLTLAAVTSEIISDLAAGREPDAPLAALRPDRF